MASQPEYPRIPLRVDLAEAVVRTGLVIAERLLRTGRTDPKVQEYVSVLREFHADTAMAEFDLALGNPPRNGITIDQTTEDMKEI